MRWAPLPSRKKIGVPPTPRNARTGEFTPPGMSRWESSNSFWLRSSMMKKSSESFGAGAALDLVIAVKKCTDHGNGIRATGNKCTRIGGSNTADGHGIEAVLARRGKQIDAGSGRFRLGGGGEATPEGDIICALFRGSLSEATIVVAGYPYDTVRQFLARVRNCFVVTP